jgi:hydroxyacylglutathione hydrolase
MSLPRESVIYPGHDYGSSPTSTLGRELEENPYLNVPSLDAFIGMTTGGYGL